MCSAKDTISEENEWIEIDRFAISRRELQIFPTNNRGRTVLNRGIADLQHLPTSARVATVEVMDSLRSASLGE
jgi:hypothetical protein